MSHVASKCGDLADVAKVLEKVPIGVWMSILPSKIEDVIDSGYTIGRRLNLDVVVGLHESWRGHHKGGVGNSTSCRNDLTRAALMCLA